VADLDAIDMGPLVRWLPDVPSRTYTGLQRYTKSCLEVMTMASPLKKGLGMTRCYIPNVIVPEAARLG
jgi:hypothetical protein